MVFFYVGCYADKIVYMSASALSAEMQSYDSYKSYRS